MNPCVSYFMVMFEAMLEKDLKFSLSYGTLYLFLVLGDLGFQE
jgi:hypothetical protein